MASITPSLDDVPLACDKGSKISLMGEDGDVSLDWIAGFPWRRSPARKKSCG